MNKKLFICGAIATTLLISACVKKEAPKEEDAQNAAAVSEPAAQFESLPSVEQAGQNQSVEIPAHVESNTAPAAQEASFNSATNTTEPAPAAAKPVEAKPKPVESKPVEAKPVETKPEPKPVVAKPAEVKPDIKPVKAPATQPAAEKPQLNASNKASGGKTEDDAVAAAIAAAAPAL